MQQSFTALVAAASLGLPSGALAQEDKGVHASPESVRVTLSEGWNALEPDGTRLSTGLDSPALLFLTGARNPARPPAVHDLVRPNLIEAIRSDFLSNEIRLGLVLVESPAVPLSDQTLQALRSELQTYLENGFPGETIDLALFVDRQSQASDLIGSPALPSTLLVGRDGEVLHGKGSVPLFTRFADEESRLQQALLGLPEQPKPPLEANHFYKLVSAAFEKESNPSWEGVAALLLTEESKQSIAVLELLLRDTQELDRAKAVAGGILAHANPGLSTLLEEASEVLARSYSGHIRITSGSYSFASLDIHNSTSDKTFNVSIAATLTPTWDPTRTINLPWEFVAVEPGGKVFRMQNWFSAPELHNGLGLYTLGVSAEVSVVTSDFDIVGDFTTTLSLPTFNCHAAPDGPDLLSLTGPAEDIAAIQRALADLADTRAMLASGELGESLPPEGLIELKVGQEFPAIRAASPGAEALSTLDRSIFEDKVVVVHLMFPSCGACWSGMPALAALPEAGAEGEVQVISLVAQIGAKGVSNVRDHLERVRERFERGSGHKVEHPFYILDNGAERALGLVFPTYLVVVDGTITFFSVGGSLSKQVIEDAVAKLRAGSQ